MIGTCSECVEKQKTLKDYCCVLCAMGLTLGHEKVIKDPFTGTIYVDLSKGFIVNHKEDE